MAASPLGLSAGDPSTTDFLYGSFDPFSDANIGVPSLGTGAVPNFDGSSLSTSAAVNPNPTGDWMSSVTDALSAAQKSFSSYVQSSPSVAVPRPIYPVTQGIVASNVPAMPTSSWLLIGAVALGLIWIVHSHLT